MGCVSSLSIVDCCRCISAVQKPRAAPAQVFAALNHMLIQGFFIAFLAKAGEREVLGPVPGYCRGVVLMVTERPVLGSRIVIAAHLFEDYRRARGLPASRRAADGSSGHKLRRFWRGP